MIEYIVGFILLAMFFVTGLIGGLNEPPSQDDGGFHPYP